LEELDNVLEIKEGDHILDAGCGTGFMIEKIVKENVGRRISVVGLDSSKGMLERARKKFKNYSNVKLQVADLNKHLEFPDNSFDKVICSNTLYALENPQKVIAEFYRVLKLGAVVVITNPKPDAQMKKLAQEQLRTMTKLTPFYNKIYHILRAILLLPIIFAVTVINKIILKKGKKGEYQFLDNQHFRSILQEVGFKSVYISSCYADQNWLVKAAK